MNPRRVVAALVRRSVLGDVDRRAAIFAAERQALHQAQGDQNDGRGDAPARVAGYDADEEGAETHQGHRDEERVFAADQVAEVAEDQRAERAHGEARGEREQREDEADIRRHVGEEIFCQEHAERSVDVEVVPLEDGAERRSENDEPLFARHAAGLRRVYCHGCHGRTPLMLVVRNCLRAATIARAVHFQR